MSILNLIRRPRPRYTGPIASNGAGMLVTHDTALSHPTVWGCVRYICETVGGLDWRVMQAANGRQEQIGGGAVDWILNKQANPEMTAVTWRETALAHVLLTGNHYSEIQRDVMGRPLWLWPLLPQTVTMYRDPLSNELKYSVWQEGGDAITLDARDVFHVKGLTWDGVAGYSVVTVARRSMGIGLAMDEFGANFYRNGTHVGLVFEHPRTMSEKAQENFKESLNERSGPGNAFRSIVVEEGMKLTKAQMTMVDAQFVEWSKKNGVDICQWFRVPPHKVGILDRATFSNIEHQSIEAVQDCIQPWCNKLDQEADIKLFGNVAQRSMYTELDTSSLERGDMKTRYEALAIGRNSLGFSVNDVMHELKRNPIGPEGDTRLQPLNYGPLGAEPEPNDAATVPAVSNSARAKVIRMQERLQRIGHG